MDQESAISSPPKWDCRWPDPVALQVASERLLAEMREERSDLNHRLPVVVRMEGVLGVAAFSRALLISPWAVERVYWNHLAQAKPPLQTAFPLEADQAGRVAKGQAGLLEIGEPPPKPVVVGWEPETGHYFVQTLLHSVQGYASWQQALDAALGKTAPSPVAASLSDTLSKSMDQAVSRRRLFWFLR